MPLRKYISFTTIKCFNISGHIDANYNIYMSVPVFQMASDFRTFADIFATCPDFFLYNLQDNLTLNSIGRDHDDIKCDSVNWGNVLNFSSTNGNTASPMLTCH